jgi:hypothetical protein
MANRNPRFWFRRLAHHNVNHGLGTCEGCDMFGPVNRLCLHCCVAMGMVLGRCYACDREGPINENCHWCEQGRYLVVGYGMCLDCEWLGTVGEGCPICEGDAVITVLAEESDTELEEICVMVITQEPESDSDSDSGDSTTPDEAPVPDRNRSSTELVPDRTRSSTEAV